MVNINFIFYINLIKLFEMYNLKNCFKIKKKLLKLPNKVFEIFLKMI